MQIVFNEYIKSIPSHFTDAQASISRLLDLKIVFMRQSSRLILVKYRYINVDHFKLLLLHYYSYLSTTFTPVSYCQRLQTSTHYAIFFYHQSLFYGHQEANEQPSYFVGGGYHIIAARGDLQHQKRCVYVASLESPVYSLFEQPHIIAQKKERDVLIALDFSYGGCGVGFSTSTGSAKIAT